MFEMINEAIAAARQGDAVSWRELTKRAYKTAFNSDDEFISDTVGDLLYTIAKLKGNGPSLSENAVNLLVVAKKMML